MKTRNTRFVAVLLVISSLCLMTSSVFAAGAEDTFSTKEYDVTTVIYGNQPLEVPVLREVTQSASRGAVITSSEVVYVPEMTAEGLSRNSSVIQEIKTCGTPLSITPYGNGDFHVPGYIWFHSTMNYSTTYWDNYLPLYDILDFQLDREIYSEAPFDDFHKADAKALQIGTIGDPGHSELVFQDDVFNQIEYGQKYYVPSEWEPVAPVDGGAAVGVIYTVTISYGDGRDECLEYTHRCV